MEPLKKRFDIKILGQELSVSSDSGDEHVAKVVGYVTERVEEIGRTAGKATTLNVAILTALNIADEYFKLKGENERIVKQLEARSENLIHLINELN
ncbi:MAG: cell division protein ZapA [Syntrophales bacterium]|jgi:cell division protein ZapA|nr:cell division protein ZapA [Syntrophales bacterium]MDD4340224.1 cell division protein ZapA [Syntrophales bacterium]HOG08066.1 cell division protein ZapA [Syntrophales bacterium]HQN26436.1 cell division protein ZapA [Syntrophales bacterium]HQP28884.1 cell division protein ZapA [Syntrophales bacterium]